MEIIDLHAIQLWQQLVCLVPNWRLDIENCDTEHSALSEDDLRDVSKDVRYGSGVYYCFQGLAELCTILERDGALPSEIAVAIETMRGIWIHTLLERGYQVYGINPKMIENFRQASSAAGIKTDQIDAEVLAQFIATVHKNLKPLCPDDPGIAALRRVCEIRLRLIEEHTAKVNEQQAMLQLYYAAVIGLFGDIDSDVTLEFLQSFPTQKSMKSLTKTRLKSWLARHKYTRMNRFERMAEMLKKPVLEVPDYQQAANSTLIQYLAKSILALNEKITECDDRVKKQFEQMPDSVFIKSLPGGAGKVIGPSLLVCLGRNGKRFSNIHEARALLGTAPVTKQSGTMCAIYFRRGCWKFARRTLHLYAEMTCRYSSWARQYYLNQRKTGHRHHATVRALAHKWLKIIFAMLRNKTLYDENVFVDSQRRYLLKKQQLTGVYFF